MDCSWKSHPTHLTANSTVRLRRTLQQGRRGNQGRDKYPDRCAACANPRPGRLRSSERQGIGNEIVSRTTKRPSSFEEGSRGILFAALACDLGSGRTHYSISSCMAYPTALSSILTPTTPPDLTTFDIKSFSYFDLLRKSFSGQIISFHPREGRPTPALWQC